MSAADRLRSWRSADKNKCGDQGEVRSGGPKARKKDAGLARKMAGRPSELGSRDRDVVAAKAQRFSPQSRAPRGGEAQTHQRERGAEAKTHQTDFNGGNQIDQTALNGGNQIDQIDGATAMKHGECMYHGQRQFNQCGLQSRVRARLGVCSDRGKQTPMEYIILLHWMPSGKGNQLI